MSRHSFYDSPRGYGWRVRLAWFVLHFGCRHPRGTICRHRQYEYDHYLTCSNSGYTSGVLYERSPRQAEKETA
jgi:hypothetical protein